MTIDPHPTFKRRRRTVAACLVTLAGTAFVACSSNSGDADTEPAPSVVESGLPERLAGPGVDYIWNGLPVVCEDADTSLFRIDDNPDSMPLCMTDDEAATAAEWSQP